ncbi:MAG: capsule assembly Wzi family protein [Ignavibacteria bacterium]|nr:capsule assembly Wzi family protein [Ignavibacteria bacterium]
MAIKSFIITLTITVSCFQTILFSQSNFVDVNSRVYNFLSKMSIKGEINFNEFSLPLTRKEISEYLKVIDASKISLTPLERNELEWYLNEYYAETYDENLVTENPKFFSDDGGRLRPFFFRNENFSYAASPIIKYEMNSFHENFLLKRFWGFNVYGNVNKSFSFQFDFREYLEEGDLIDRRKQFTTETGPIILKASGNNIQFSETRGSVIYSNEWLAFGGVKEKFKWGSGERGNLILSTKAHSFPSIYLKISPADWIQFYYMHGWLLSRVRDSLASYKTEIEGRPRNIDRPKYIAMHALQLNPFNNLSLTFGETIVYSDISPYWGYLNPFLFYRSVDHMFEGGGGSNVGNNGSLFMDLKYKPYRGYQLYGSLYIDELSVEDILKGDNARNQFAWSMGAKAYGILSPHLGLNIEYTRILPWVYSNFVPTQTYTNSGYLMGHYIGQNADQIFVQLDYLILRGLELKLWTEMIRRGGISEVKYQYLDPGEEFLYGKRMSENRIGLEISYEVFHDTFAKCYYEYSNIKDEDGTRTPSWQLGKNHAFGISFGYGF